ncbi:glutaminase A [Brochothrix campestris]|uniref:Glutaminase n=1 Tax=Brochothrix campestris FSL F6-1037 TaxID=1265861 RepID=W7D1F9_9LIST|nr:glutaminase A [Brochothrix campestris]EUJ39178.1 glutaminase [Brochothrix campestris FSL F6-1037]
MQQLLEQLVETSRKTTIQGKVATYIPALAEADAAHFSVCLTDKGQSYAYGETDTLFTLQSVVKVISFMLAADYHGLTRMMDYVDVEPTGDSFNSIVRLESANTKPFNPMINAGAITVASMLPGDTPTDKVATVLTFLETLLQKEVTINQKTYQSEYDSADHNRAIAYILKANGYLEAGVENAIQTYLQLCSIEVTVSDLAQIALFFAEDGQNERICIDGAILKVSKALMLTCGMYNSSGKFAAFVGLPAKSGVSGAIIAVVKSGAIEILEGPIGIGLYGPAIDEVGNSVAGVHFLMALVKKYNLSVF